MNKFVNANNLLNKKKPKQTNQAIDWLNKQLKQITDQQNKTKQTRNQLNNKLNNKTSKQMNVCMTSKNVLKKQTKQSKLLTN